MKTMNYKFPVSAILFLLLVISFESCKKKGEEITAEKLTTELTAGDSSLWRFPSALVDPAISIVCLEGATPVPLLLLKTGVENKYEYSEGGTAASCTRSGSFSISYTASRTGQDISLTLNSFNSDGSPLLLKLQYSSSDGTFYYIDAEKGLLPLVKEMMLGWREMNSVSQNLSTNHAFTNRTDFVSVTYGGKVYFGMGRDELGVYNDWYSFDGTTVTELTASNIPYLFGARAIVKNGKIYIVGGKTVVASPPIVNKGQRIAGGAGPISGVEVPNENTFSCTLSGSWNDEGKELTAVQDRSNAVYFTLANQEVLAFGSEGALTPVVSNIFYRNYNSTEWVQDGTSGGVVYGSEPSHAYEYALCFPWKGGYWIGGGVYGGDSYTDFVAFASSKNNATININTQSNNLSTIFSGGFSEGAGVSLGLTGALVYGIKDVGGSYSNDVYYVNYKSDFSKPIFRSAISGPVPGRSTVLWKLEDANGKVRVFAGLGATDVNLYELIIK